LGEAGIGSFVTIICSDTARCGKTLLARVYAGLYALRRENNPLIFDTDLSGNGIINYLPQKTRLIDLSKVADQIILFDTIVDANKNRRENNALDGAPDFVVDVASSELVRFFTLFHNIGFEQGAGEAGFDVRIYYLVSWTQKSLQTGAEIAAMLTRSRFLAVRNMAIAAYAFTPEPSDGARVAKINISLFLNALSPAAFAIVNEHSFSFSRFISGGYKTLTHAIRLEIWDFLEAIYNQTNADMVKQ